MTKKPLFKTFIVECCGNQYLSSPDELDENTILTCVVCAAPIAVKADDGRWFAVGERLI